LSGRKLEIEEKQPLPQDVYSSFTDFLNSKERVMKKLMFVSMVIFAVAVSQTMFAQDKAIEKKVEKVVKIEKNSNKEENAKKECSDKMECCKDKRCCDKCSGEKCDGTCCAKCAECKKACKEKCEMGNKEKCIMDSTAKCKNQDMKKHMEKKIIINKEGEIENKK